MSDKKVLLVGAGGHASVCLDLCIRNNISLFAVVSPEHPSAAFKQLQWLQSDNDVLTFDTNDVVLINGLGSLPYDHKRQEIYQFFATRGYDFMSINDPSAIISDNATLNTGVQVLPRAIINSGALIKENSIINSGAIIEHDVTVGQNCHIAPGANLSGGVNVGNNVHIGTGANIIQGLTIGHNSIIAAGATVNKSIPDNHIVYAPKMTVTPIKEKR
ncbi:acetyltransferase [Idiomarina abyssalis]|uniref:acetyltransferase n=1 Tax=Idiomarina abyssalis TaxID=86102 RepID=UPI002301F0A6|nr:acetyltransferase [Idiomarina abyssalis]MDA6066564.1 acetyltransferase [Idiomarina abyssalis]